MVGENYQIFLPGESRGLPKCNSCYPPLKLLFGTLGKSLKKLLTLPSFALEELLNLHKKLKL